MAVDSSPFVRLVMSALRSQNPRDGSIFYDMLTQKPKCLHNELHGTDLLSCLATLGLSKISDNTKIGWTCIPFSSSSTCQFNLTFFRWGDIAASLMDTYSFANRNIRLFVGKISEDPYPPLASTAETAAIYQCHVWTKLPYKTLMFQSKLSPLSPFEALKPWLTMSSLECRSQTTVEAMETLGSPSWIVANLKTYFHIRQFHWYQYDIIPMIGRQHFHNLLIKKK